MEHSVYRDLEEEEATPNLAVQPARASSLLPIAQGDNVIGPRELAEWRWANVDNLDVFFQDVYQYYLDKGFWCILIQRILNMLTVLFVVGFTTYLTACIDFTKIISAQASTVSEAHRSACLSGLSIPHKLALWVFGALWFAKCFSYVGDIRRLWEIHDFYAYLLEISESDVQTISWQIVVQRVSKLKNLNLVTSRRRALDAHSIVNRIMRKENYLISLYNKDVMDLNVTLPLVGPYQFLTKTLEWNISLCIMDYVFSAKGQLRTAFLKESQRSVLAAGLRRRFQFVALMNVIFAPAAVVYMSLYYFFRYFNDYRTKPTYLGTRRYIPLAEWKFRELNELYHLFRRRLSMSEQPAMRYISQFPNVKTEIVLRFSVFIASALVAVLGVIALIEPESVVNLHIANKSSGFYIAGLSIVIAAARGMTNSEAAIFQPDTAMRQIVEFTHYLPEHWETWGLHNRRVKAEFCNLYDLKLKILLRDLASIFINPFLLWYQLPRRAERIVDFFRESSVHVDELGYVCSYAQFNIDKAAKVKARSDVLDKYYATADGKMLKSYLNFMDIYGPPESRGLGLSNRSLEPESPNLERSVMGQYDRLRNLSPVAEEVTTTNASWAPEPRSGTSDDISGMLSSEADADEESVANNGVLGLLNNVYKTDGRPPR